MTDQTCRLYLITPPALDPVAFKEDLAAALDGGDVGALQLRLKDVADDDVKRAVEVLLPVAQARDVPFILNDRPDLAQATGCDGVHVGQQDAAYGDARETMGDNAIVGVTCHDSRHLSIEAAEAGADYVAFGAFFPTATKEAKFRASPEILQWWRDLMQIPCVAIGGITADNGTELVHAGADFLAVVGAVWNHADGPAAGVQAMNDIMTP
ncbi:MAG: thiamine phosphate synthase [Rhodospirillaceae bacterium]|jgi:thiamine-phosphate pyrophosphorylase|nr:thiamine phosphate synthase [Rhodospirillaceae bacterium]